METTLYKLLAIFSYGFVLFDMIFRRGFLDKIFKWGDNLNENIILDMERTELVVLSSERI